MNTKLILLTIIASAFLIIQPAEAAKKNRNRGNQSVPAASDPLQSEGPAPAQQLAPYIQRIDQLLALSWPADSAGAFEQAQGRLALLKQSFATAHAAAEPAQRAAFEAALATTNQLTAALDERKQTVAKIDASTATKGSDDLGERRKDNLTDGVKGRRKAKAAKLEFKREKIANEEARREAAQRDDSMAARSVERWNQRAIELRKKVTEAYARIPAA